MSKRKRMKLDGGWAPLRWGKEFLSEFGSRLLEAQEAKHVALWNKMTAMVPEICWASACSGTESPQFVFSGFAKGILKSGKIHHLYSAELCPEKREFMGRVSSAQFTFGDMCGLSRPELWCIKNQCKIKRNQLGGVTVFVAGFSCVDIPPFKTVHTDGVVAEECAAEAQGQSGLTFRATLMYLIEMEPAICILENVSNLLKQGQYLKLKAKIEAAGYHCQFNIVADFTHLNTPPWAAPRPPDPRGGSPHA